MRGAKLSPDSQYRDGPPVESTSLPMRTPARKPRRSERTCIKRRAVAELQKLGWKWWEIAAAMDVTERWVAEYVRKNRELRREVLTHAG